MIKMGCIEMSLRRAVTMAFVCIMLISACNKNEKPSANSDLGDETVFGVVGKTIVSTDIERKISVSAVVYSSIVASVVPDMQGTLIELKVRKGDAVVKGQTLGMINASKAGSTFLTSPLSSPVSGQVSEILAEVGNEVSPTKGVVEVIDNAKLELRVSVSEKDVPFITENTRGIFMLPAAIQSNGETLQSSFEIHVLSVNKVFSDKSSTMRVLVEFSESVSHVRSGAVGVLSLVLEKRKNAVVIPKNIIVQRFFGDGFKNGVFVLTDKEETISEVSFRPLDLGIEVSDVSNTAQQVVEVITGLAMNEVVIVKGYNALADKAKVRIFEFDGIEESQK